MTAGPKRILVADDDPEIRHMLTAVLQQHELVVDAAADGYQAADLLRQFQYAVVLIDLMMPETDGFELLELMAGGSVVSPPVVLIITAADRATIERLDAQRIHGI